MCKKVCDFRASLNNGGVTSTSTNQHHGSCGPVNRDHLPGQVLDRPRDQAVSAAFGFGGRSSENRTAEETLLWLFFSLGDITKGWYPEVCV